MRRRLAVHELDIAAEATYPRGTPYSASFRPHVELLRRANPDAIIVIATYSASAGFIRDARDAGWSDIPIANISGVDSDNLLRLLQQRGRDTGKDYTANLINSQVVPSYDDGRLPAVSEYRALMDRHQPVLPEPLRELVAPCDVREVHRYTGAVGQLVRVADVPLVVAGVDEIRRDPLTARA